MAKLALVHCRVCGGEIDRNVDNWVMPSKNWYYHYSCYQEWVRKKQQTIDISYKAEEKVWKEAIYDYLAKELKMELDWTKFNSQWENFLKKGYTPKGIFFTIRYIYDIKKCDVKKAQGGIGLVANLYNEGCNYWCKREIENKGICERITAQIFALQNQKRIEVSKKKTSKKAKVNLAIIAEMEDEG